MSYSLTVVHDAQASVNFFHNAANTGGNALYVPFAYTHPDDPSCYFATRATRFDPSTEQLIFKTGINLKPQSRDAGSYQIISPTEYSRLIKCEAQWWKVFNGAKAAGGVKADWIAAASAFAATQ